MLIWQVVMSTVRKSVDKDGKYVCVGIGNVRGGPVFFIFVEAFKTP